MSADELPTPPDHTEGIQNLDGVAPSETELGEALDLVLKVAGRALDVRQGAAKGELAKALELVGGLKANLGHQGTDVLAMATAGVVVMLREATPSALEVGNVRAADVVHIEGQAVDPNGGRRLGKVAVNLGFPPYGAYDALLNLSTGCLPLKHGVSRQ